MDCKFLYSYLWTCKHDCLHCFSVLGTTFIMQPLGLQMQKVVLYGKFYSQLMASHDASTTSWLSANSRLYILLVSPALPNILSTVYHTHPNKK